MRHTKILATLGPASAEPAVIDAMIAAGADGFRLNLSHGTREWHGQVVARVREAARRAGRPVSVLVDLQGPRLRLGRLRGGQLEAPQGAVITITTRNVEGAEGVAPVEYPDLAREVKPGQRILLDDGRISLVVEEVRGPDVVCRVVTGGVLRTGKGLNLPGANLSVPALTAKDHQDARFALSAGVDYLALSFVRRAQDVRDLRTLVEAAGQETPVVAKIEKLEAVDALEEILAAAQGVMVARGDLGVEVSLEMIPALQKRIISQANRAGRLVITATQMLESMTENASPTRAEVSDVANAILDGTDVLMLSGETAVGKHPVEAVRRMAAITGTTEERLYPYGRPVFDPPFPPAQQGGYFGRVAARLAGQASQAVDARAMVVFTRGGRTARLLSYQRPRAPILAFTVDPAILQRLALQWGVVPLRIPEMGSVEDLVSASDLLVLERGWASRGEPVIYLLGTSTAPGATNSVRIGRVGEEDRPGPVRPPRSG